MERSSDWDRFGELMVRLAELFGPSSTLKIQAYWMALYQYNWSDVEFAAMRCLQTRQSSGGFPASWPTPADLIALMWNDLDAVPDAPVVTGRKALPEPRADPEVVRSNLAAVQELLSKTKSHLPSMPRLKDESQDPYRGNGPNWFMLVKNWRARWDLYRMDPEYKPLADAIPQHLRLKFAAEDAKRSEEPPY